MKTRNNASIAHQIKLKFDGMLVAGNPDKDIRSKYHDQERGLKEGDSNLYTKDKIYSFSTYRDYIKQASYFGKWAKAEHNCKLIDNARPYVNEYLQKCIDDKLSACTIKLRASAIAKLYRCSTRDFIQTPARHRADIRRSRGEAVRDKKFLRSKDSEELIHFCRATGLRRNELRHLRKEQLVYVEDLQSYCIRIQADAKGGRLRYIPVSDKQVLQRFRDTPAGGKVWASVHSCADIHSYRADYATAIYKKYARSKDELLANRKEKIAELKARGLKGTELTKELNRQDSCYFCRRDLKHIVYDKEAMKIVSDALGHTRISVIAGHYLRDEVL